MFFLVEIFIVVGMRVVEMIRYGKSVFSLFFIVIFWSVKIGLKIFMYVRIKIVKNDNMFVIGVFGISIEKSVDRFII